MKKVKYFILNGERFYIEHHLTLSDLLEYFDYENSLLVLEHNSQISSKISWKTRFIQNQDKIEIVSIVGGG